MLRIHDVSQTVGVSEDDFVRICPSLIHQLHEGVCNQAKQPNSDAEEHADDKMLHGKSLDLRKPVKTRNFKHYSAGK